MPLQSCILMLAGHADHGKTALVKALTGNGLDRLPEEKKRGLTIDLGFTALELSEGRYRLAIIDVPGHADFVKNMLAGTGGVDVGLLVVAADDGWMPQTEEHFQILSYLKVKRLVVAVNKADLDPDITDLVVKQVRKQLEYTAYAQAPIIPTSTLSQTGLEQLRKALEEMAASLPETVDFGRARFFIDRVFTVVGQGSVVTGTLQGGFLAQGQSLTWFPFEETLRVRSLQSHGQEIPEAGPGTRLAINLSTVDGNKHSLDRLERGQLLCDEHSYEAIRIIDTVLTRSGRRDHILKKGLRPLKHDARVRLHFGSSNVAAQLILLNTAELLPGEQALARLKLEKPSVFIMGDRFIIRDWSEQTTLCGGVVLDPLPSPNSAPRRGPQNVYLQTMVTGPHTPEQFLKNLVKRDSFLHRHEIEWRFPVSEEAFGTLCIKQEKDGIFQMRGDWLIKNNYWKEGLQKIKELIHLHHKNQPQDAGLLISTIRKCFDNHPGKMPLHLFLDTLAQNGYVVEDTHIREINHQPHLTEQLKAAEGRLLKTFSDDVEKPCEIDQDTSDQVQVLRYLMEKQSVVPIGTNGFLLKKAYNEKLNRVVDHLNKNREARVSELKEAAKLSRKYLVPFLESLDKQGITIRNGDFRSLGRAIKK